MGHENPGREEEDLWKSPAFPWHEHSGLPLRSPFQKPLKHLAETSLYHTPYDGADGKTEAEMDESDRAPVQKPLASALAAGAHELQGGTGRTGSPEPALGGWKSTAHGPEPNFSQAEINLEVRDVPRSPPPFHGANQEIEPLPKSILEFSLSLGFSVLRVGTMKSTLLFLTKE